MKYYNKIITIYRYLSSLSSSTDNDLSISSSAFRSYI